MATKLTVNTSRLELVQVSGSCTRLIVRSVHAAHRRSNWLCISALKSYRSFFHEHNFSSWKKKKAQLVTRAGDGLDQLGVLAVVCGAFRCWSCAASRALAFWALFGFSNALLRFTLQLSFIFWPLIYEFLYLFVFILSWSYYFYFFLLWLALDGI